MDQRAAACLRAYTHITKVDDCWISTYSVAGSGYAQVGYKVAGRVTMLGAHRAAFEHEHGPIPEGMVIDHRCMNRRCVNPAHLEAVPPRTNTERGGFTTGKRALTCRKGHPRSPETGHFRSSDGAWFCRVCLRIRKES